eukprot:9699800-Alexandrium_andersonii.AAC.1
MMLSFLRLCLVPASWCDHQVSASDNPHGVASVREVPDGPRVRRERIGPSLTSARDSSLVKWLNCQGEGWAG